MKYHIFLLITLNILALLFTTCKSMKGKGKSKSNKETPTYFVTPGEFHHAVHTMTSSEDDPVREQMYKKMKQDPKYLQLPPNQQKEMGNLVKNGPKSSSSSRTPQPFQSSNQFQSNQFGSGQSNRFGA
ncbi:hypothetical protein niasHT_035745 [Heterodera trifolii]|uniref:Uncharacterized protein n=1 Tax=Heterodera trifolii TaxID=157864 RepID=A0ABD2IQX1_9BILA